MEESKENPTIVFLVDFSDYAMIFFVLWAGEKG